MTTPTTTAGSHIEAEQIRLRCVLMRGGTSKALFFHEADLPPQGPQRDRLLKRAMGSPDVLQIDGMGGSRLVTSKVAILKRSSRPDADVDYSFAQVDVERDGVLWNANCGNISSAVGPFCIDEGLVDQLSEPVTTVRIHNTNTGKILVAKVQVAGRRARVTGDCVIPGVPGSGAEVAMDFSDTVGAGTGRLLPTGHVTDMITLETGRQVEVTMCDAGNPCVFINAQALGLGGSELPPAISADRALIETIGEIQCKAGQAMGLWADWRSQHLPVLPAAIVVAPPVQYTDVNGAVHAPGSMDFRGRFVFLGKCHDSMAGSGAVCSAAASRIPDSVLHRLLPPAALATRSLRIGHPLGVMQIGVEVDPASSLPDLRFTTLSFPRTARRLMDGFVYVPV